MGIRKHTCSPAPPRGSPPSGPCRFTLTKTVDYKQADPSINKCDKASEPVVPFPHLMESQDDQRNSLKTRVDSKVSDTPPSSPDVRFVGEE